MQERFLKFWDELFPPVGGEASDRSQPLHILISTHAALTRHALEAFRARSYSFPDSYNPKDKYGNCSITTVQMDFVHGQWRGSVTELGGTGHLKEMATNNVGDAVETVIDALA